jgi:glycosyltransferase involved in cell wall biosynthesis
MISIIIPTFNEEKAIEATLRPLKANLHLLSELIVSDGGSADRTAEIARKYADKVIVYSGKERQNIAKGRNDGAKAAAGDYFVFLDADCTIMEPDKFFGRAIAHFEKDKKLVGLMATLRVLPEFETFADRFFLGLMNSLVRFKNNVLRQGEAVGGEFQMMRREAFFAINGYREDLITREDRDMFFRLAKIGRTYCDKALVVYHTGRRAHVVGWWHLLGLWVVNIVFYHIHGKVFSKEWKPIR